MQLTGDCGASYHHVSVHAHNTSVDGNERYQPPGSIYVSGVKNVVAIGSL